MIDTKELRRLVQAAMHPVTKGRWMRLFGERTVYDRMEDGCRGIPVVSTPFSPPHPFEAACLDFIAAANPAVISELLDRLEAAEADALEQARLNGMGSEREAALMAKLEAAEKSDAESLAMYRRARDERDALRAKIARMERQEPVAWARKLAMGLPSFGCVTDLKYRPSNIPESSYIPLYALPGAQAQPAPIEQDESVRKSWVRFSNELHRSPDAPYPGMSEAFEQHFSQSFTDRDWRAESGTWAAAWKAAKRHGAQPAPSLASDDVSLISEGKTQPAQSVKDAIIDDLQSQFDTEGITEHDSGDALIRLSDAIAAVEDNFAQPTLSIPEGWKLVPIEPTEDMLRAMTDPFIAINGDNRKAFEIAYTAMLSAAPEVKP